MVYRRINTPLPAKKGEVCENLTLVDIKRTEESTNLLRMILLNYYADLSCGENHAFETEKIGGKQE